MRLIVGLGNPGRDYEQTPHNLGFLVVDKLAQDAEIRVNRPEGGAEVGLGEIEREKVVLAKPLSYMNLSGGPVKSLLGKYELQASDLLVIYDDLDLPWGQLRLKQQGSAGGHRGMESVIGSLGTMDFERLRLGIHPGRPVGDAARYVLRRLSREESEELEEIVERAAEIVRLLISEGAEKAMSVANRRAGRNQNEDA